MTLYKSDNSALADKTEKRKDSWYANSNKEDSLFDDVTEFIGKNKGKIGGAAAAIVAAPVALGAVGFGAGGVAAGGIAAAVQGAFYGGATGGAFAALQAAGAGGIGLGANIVIGGAGSYFGSFFDKEDEEKNDKK